MKPQVVVQPPPSFYSTALKKGPWVFYVGDGVALGLLVQPQHYELLKPKLSENPPTPKQNHGEQWSSWWFQPN